MVLSCDTHRACEGLRFTSPLSTHNFLIITEDGNEVINLSSNEIYELIDYPSDIPYSPRGVICCGRKSFRQQFLILC